MRRVALILATFAILCVTASQVQAHHHGHGYHHGGWYGPAVVRPHAWVAPPMVMPVPVYPPVYRPRYYYPTPGYGFYYQGRGVSVGVGF